MSGPHLQPTRVLADSVYHVAVAAAVGGGDVLPQLSCMAARGCALARAHAVAADAVPTAACMTRHLSDETFCTSCSAYNLQVHHQPKAATTEPLLPTYPEGPSVKLIGDQSTSRAAAPRGHATVSRLLSSVCSPHMQNSPP